ncbi:MAG: hypothetical protein EOO15_04220 [Chitinophagaceae bacterium]|nr:MAG: hypothetical protein EOO15_04220 [Chitinophagaceae bacterium]
MRKRILPMLLLLAAGRAAAQDPKAPPKAVVDSIAYYDALFDDMAEFLDSITAPRTFFLVDVGMSSAYFNYVREGSYDLETRRQQTWTPSVGYYHKNGLGLTLSSTFVNDDASFKPYQYVATASYDYLQRNDFSTGASYTRYFTKKDLSFYTTPLQNEVGAYFTYKKWWMKPAVFASYGWGSRSAFDEREAYIISLRLRPDGITRIETSEKINDFSLSLSMRHDFYRLNFVIPKSSLRITPQIVFTSGTQKFGFNQNANTYGIVRATSLNELVSTQNQSLDDQLYFQPLSLSGMLRLEWSWKGFFLQPQYVGNYYFPAGAQNYAGLFRVNIGYIF